MSDYKIVTSCPICGYTWTDTDLDDAAAFLDEVCYDHLGLHDMTDITAALFSKKMEIRKKK